MTQLVVDGHEVKPIILVDSSGNSYPADKLPEIKDILYYGNKEKSNYGSSTGAALTVDLDCGEWGGRAVTNVWVKSSAAADFVVQVKRDGGDTYREVATINLSGAGEKFETYNLAYRNIRVTTTDENNNEAEIVASR